MRKTALAVAALLMLWVGLPSAFAGDGTPQVYGDIALRPQVRTNSGVTLNRVDLAYNVGIHGEFDWLSYNVAFNNNGGRTNDNWSQLVNTFTGAAAAPSLIFANMPIAVRLARASFTINVLDVLFLGFGILDNPKARAWYEFRWDRDKAVYGAAQRLEIGNFFGHAVWHAETNNAPVVGGVAPGSVISNGSYLMIAVDLGYNFELTDRFALQFEGEYIFEYDRHEVGLNVMLDIAGREGYPVLVWASGYLPVNKSAADGFFNFAGALRIQYGDLSLDETFALAVSGAVWGQGSFVNTEAGWAGPAANPNVGGGALGPNWSNWRYTQASLMFGNLGGLVAQAVGPGAGGPALKPGSYIISLGFDAWYRFASWFHFGVEVDYAFVANTLASTGPAGQSFYAALIGRTVF